MQLNRLINKQKPRGQRQIYCNWIGVELNAIVQDSEGHSGLAGDGKWFSDGC